MVQKIQPDIESNIPFECVVCVTHKPTPIKYKCTTCPKKICDDCFEIHITMKRNCVFCR